MDVEVILNVWGSYQKGDIIPNMPESTALACIKTGVVKEVNSAQPPVQKANSKKGPKK